MPNICVSCDVLHPFYSKGNMVRLKGNEARSEKSEIQFRNKMYWCCGWSCYRLTWLNFYNNHISNYPQTVDYTINELPPLIFRGRHRITWTTLFIRAAVDQKQLTAPVRDELVRSLKLGRRIFPLTQLCAAV